MAFGDDDDEGVAGGVVREVRAVGDPITCAPLEAVQEIDDGVALVLRRAAVVVRGQDDVVRQRRADELALELHGLVTRLGFARLAAVCGTLRGGLRGRCRSLSDARRAVLHVSASRGE